VCANELLHKINKPITITLDTAEFRHTVACEHVHTVNTLSTVLTRAAHVLINVYNKYKKLQINLKCGRRSSHSRKWVKISQLSIWLSPRLKNRQKFISEDSSKLKLSMARADRVE